MVRAGWDLHPHGHAFAEHRELIDQRPVEGGHAGTPVGGAPQGFGHRPEVPGDEYGDHQRMAVRR